MATAREELLTADAAWAAAAAAGDVERIITFWAPDAVNYLPETPPAVGAEAIRAVVSRWRARPEYSLHWHATRAEAAQTGDLGYTSGPFELRFRDPNDRLVIRRGHYLCVWKRQAGGEWKCAVETSVFEAPP